MSNIFQEVLNDVNGVEENLLGPSYPYYKNIRTPAEIGMGSEGTMDQLGKDIQGLIAYTNVLVSGQHLKGYPDASVPGGPLGNKFFMKTGAKCMACKDPNSCNQCGSDPSNCPQVDRYIYIDNVPDGNIPFISSGLGVNFSSFEGLIPGAMGNLNVLNPFAILGAFTSGATPPCMEITMQVIDNSNNSSMQTQYVTLTDIKNMDACTFPNHKGNPASGAPCVQTFENRKKKNKKVSMKLSKNLFEKLYFACLSLLGIYILYSLMRKK